MGEASTLGNNIGIMAIQGYLTCTNILSLSMARATRSACEFEMAETSIAVPLLSSLSNKIEVRDRPSDEYIRVSVGKAGEDFHLGDLREALSTKMLAIFSLTCCRSLAWSRCFSALCGSKRMKKTNAMTTMHEAYRAVYLCS